MLHIKYSFRCIPLVATFQTFQPVMTLCHLLSIHSPEDLDSTGTSGSGNMVGYPYTTC